MPLTLITVLIFIATFGLVLSAVYFLIQVPSEKKQMRTRLAAIQEATGADDVSDVDQSIIRSQVLSEVPQINRLLMQLPLTNRMHLLLHQAGMDTDLSVLLAIAFGLAVFTFLVLLVLSFGPGLALGLGVLAALAPFAVVVFKRSRRLAAFEEQFPDAMDMLARAVRAGYAFTSGLQLIADELSDPVSWEFRTTFDQQNLGMPLREALANLAVRVPLADVRIFVSALQIQRESGGNLAEILDNLSYVIRERFKLYRQVKVYTAEGRLSLFVLTALPPAAALGFFLSNPNYMAPLFSDPLGHQMIAAGIVLQVLGFLVIKKIVTLKV